MDISLFSVFLTNNISRLDKVWQTKLFLNYLVVINMLINVVVILHWPFLIHTLRCSDIHGYYCSVSTERVTFCFLSFQVDFEQLQENLCQMERRCKASWDHLKAIAKHEMKPPLKQKMSEFLKDCAERIIILKIVHRRIINRYRLRVMKVISW